MKEKKSPGRISHDACRHVFILKLCDTQDDDDLRRKRFMREMREIILINVMRKRMMNALAQSKCFYEY